ncbi:MULTISPECIES: CZB domain-containing protein [Shewanella]
MQEVIQMAADTAFLNTTKLDHAVWKNNIYRLIEQQKFSESVNDHTSCRLGKWYFQGLGAEQYQNKPGFRELDSPHRQVHDAGRQALKAREKGQLKEMVKQLDSMERASLQVVRCLDRLLEN